MQISNILFDLDGTLIDSIAGIEFAINAAVAATLPHRKLPSFQMLIGPPIRELLEQVLDNVELHTLDDIISRFREIYDREGWQYSIAYEGVRTTLDSLREQQIVSWIVTNKPILPTNQILDRLEMRKFFTGVFSPDSQIPHFQSKTAMVTQIIAKYGLDPRSTLLVGDSQDDALAACSNSLHFAWASYGYGNLDLNNFPVATQLSQIANLLDEITSFTPKLSNYTGNN
jgi:phosphoglycolate phosphatase